MSPAAGLRDCSCVAHVHSAYSDGTATVDELLAAAAANGRDALLLTDHDTMAARDEGWEGRHGDVLLVVGTEVSPKDGHVLAFDLDGELAHEGLGEAEILAELERRGGFAFIAHPFSSGSRMSRRIAPAHGWGSLERGGFAGIELWSLVTDSAEAWRSPREALAFMRAPERFLTGPPVAHLRMWDGLCRTRRVAALGGLDAHQSGFRIGGRVLSPMRNERYFGLLGTHLLVREPFGLDAGADRMSLLEALREGRGYLALDFIGDPRGFSFWVEDSSSKVTLGGVVAVSGEGTLNLRAPATAELRVIRDGSPFRSATAARLECRIENPGVYRAEVWRREGGADRLWIASNPIYVGG